MAFLARMALAFFVTGGLARAESPTIRDVGNRPYQCRLPIKADDLIDYAANPSDMLKDMPNGGDHLSWRVRTVAAAGREGLKIVGRSFRLANLNQKQSIGEGLARAASSCEALSSDVTTRIADMLRESGDRDVIRAFTRFLSNEEAADSGAPAGPAAEEERAGKRLPNEGPIEGAGDYFTRRIEAGAVRAP